MAVSSHTDLDEVVPAAAVEVTGTSPIACPSDEGITVLSTLSSVVVCSPN